MLINQAAASVSSYRVATASASADLWRSGEDRTLRAAVQAPIGVLVPGVAEVAPVVRLALVVLLDERIQEGPRVALRVVLIMIY